MDKDEILSKSREENKNSDIFDFEVQKKAAGFAVYSVAILSLLISIIEKIITKQNHFECWIVFFGMTSVIFFYKFIKMGKKHELFVFIFYFVMFILSWICFIFQLLGKF